MASLRTKETTPPSPSNRLPVWTSLVPSLSPKVAAAKLIWLLSDPTAVPNRLGELYAAGSPADHLWKKPAQEARPQGGVRGVEEEDALPSQGGGRRGAVGQRRRDLYEVQIEARGGAGTAGDDAVVQDCDRSDLRHCKSARLTR